MWLCITNVKFYKISTDNFENPTVYSLDCWVHYYPNYRFEAFNSVIRGLNVNSNRHASSLDICTKLAKMERLRFILNGGKWGSNHR